MGLIENAYFDSLNTRELGIWAWPAGTWLQKRLAIIRLEHKLERLEEVHNGNSK